MKIVETEDEVLKVYSDGENVYLEFEDRSYVFTPLEAQSLCESLKKHTSGTSYFGGLNGVKD